MLNDNKFMETYVYNISITIIIDVEQKFTMTV